MTSATTGIPIPGIEVGIAAAEGQHWAVTGENGWAVFDQLTITDTLHGSDLDLQFDLSELPGQEVVELSVDHPDYLPAVVSRPLSENSRTNWISLVPIQSAASSGLVSAATGGRAAIPGVGVVRIPPGALNQDATIHAIPVPPGNYMKLPGYDTSIDQVWIGTKNVTGDWVDALPSSYSGVELIRPLRLGSLPLPEGAELDFRGTLLDRKGVVVGSDVASPSGETIAFAAGPGVNALVLSVRFPSNEGEPGSTSGEQLDLLTPCKSTFFEYVEESSEIIPHVQGPLLCGITVTGMSASIETGEEITSTHSLDSSVTAKVSSSIGSSIAKIGTELGSTLSAGTTSGTTVGISKKGMVSLSSGDLLPGGSCFDALIKMGTVVKTYRVKVVERTVYKDSDGEPQLINRDVFVAGSVSVPGTVETWWTALEFSPNCPDCSLEEGETPPSPPDVAPYGNE